MITMEDNKINNDNKLSLNDLDNVAGGEYDPDVTYLDAQVIRSGNLYSLYNIREAVGQIQAGQKVFLHPDFLYYIDGVELCIVKVGVQDYVTERANIA